MKRLLTPDFGKFMEFIQGKEVVVGTGQCQICMGDSKEISHIFIDTNKYRSETSDVIAQLHKNAKTHGICKKCWFNWTVKSRNNTCPTCRSWVVPIIPNILDINEKSAGNHNKTALMVAAENGHLDIVQFLISKGANSAISVGRLKMTALNLAAKNGHEDIFYWLLDHGAYIIIDQNGISDFMYACLWGHDKAVKLYLDTGLFDPRDKITPYEIQVVAPWSHGLGHFDSVGPYSNMNAFDMAKLGYKTHKDKKAYFNIRQMLFMDWIATKSFAVAHFFSRAWKSVSNSLLGDKEDVMPLEPGVAGPE